MCVCVCKVVSLHNYNIYTFYLLFQLITTYKLC